MQIIDKNKDYYDYCQHEFGPVDKTTAFDRRGSKVISEKDFFNHCYKYSLPRYLGKSKYWRYYGFYDMSQYMMLEIGNIQYILAFSKTEFKWIDQAASEYIIRGDVSVLHRFDEGVHLCRKPMTLVHFRNRLRFQGKGDPFPLRFTDDIEILDKYRNYAIENPVLRDTPIPSIIPAREFYNALDNYFGSMHNDKSIEIINSDIAKAENHGFDKKTSFRHPIK